MVHEHARLVRWVPLLLLGVVAVFYIWLLRDNYFFVDDFLWLEFGGRANSLSEILAVNTGHFYNPLLNLYFWLVVQITQGEAFPMYVHAVILHCLNAYLVYTLVRAKLGQTGAYTTLLLAALPYFGGEAIVWLAALPHLLVGTWLLVSFILLERYTTSRQTHYLWLANIAAVIALFTKEAAYVWPILLAAYYVWYAREPKPLRMLLKKHWLPIILYAGFMLFQYLYVLKNGSTLTHYLTWNPLPQLGSMLASGIGILWPQAAEAILHPFTTAPLLILILLLSLGIILTRYFKRNAKHTAIGILYFGLAWLIIYLIYTGLTVNSSSGNLIPPRYLYISGIGFAIMLGAATELLKRAHTFWFVAIFFILINNAYLTVKRDQMIYNPLSETTRSLVTTLPALQQPHDIYIVNDYPFSFNADYLPAILAMYHGIPKSRLHFITPQTTTPNNATRLRYDYTTAQWLTY